MNNHVLYLFVGYPGAGKTTVAKIIAKATGARHIWADEERHRLFPHPTHSEQESKELYDKLNDAVDNLLSEGKSVVFDTNFNFLSDRDKLRQIAKKHSARTIVIWVDTPLEVSKKRAVYAEENRNFYETNMTESQFDSITSKLEPPAEDEKVITIDGTDLDSQTLLDKLGIDN
jgi:predicted kinase